MAAGQRGRPLDRVMADLRKPIRASNKYTVPLLAIAEQDLVELVSYLAAENPTAAADVLDHIEARLQTLTSYPFIGRIPQASTPLRLAIAFLSSTTIWFFTK